MAPCSLGRAPTQNLIQFHNSAIRPHPLMHRVLLARMARIEKLSILVVLGIVGHC